MGDLTTSIDSRAHDKLMGDSIIPAIVDYPPVVKEALEKFGLDRLQRNPDTRYSQRAVMPMDNVLTTIGQVCISVLRQTLSKTIFRVIERVEEDGWNLRRIKVQLALP